MVTKNSDADCDNDLRSERIQAYKDLIKQTQLLARFDRPEPLNPTNLKKMTDAMRDWYFDNGGLYLSEYARPAYFKLKESIEDVLEHSNGNADAELQPPDIDSLVSLAHDLRTQLADDVGTRKSAFGKVARADPSNIQQVAASQLELINDYYSTILIQAKQSFLWAIIAAGVGLAFFVAAVCFLLFSQQTNISAISVISGALVEVISGINFYLYRKALAQLELFHVRLERTQIFLLANSVCERIRGDMQQSVRAELVRIVAGTGAGIPDVIGTDKLTPPDNKAG